MKKSSTEKLHKSRFKHLNTSSELMRALAHPLRLRIIQFIDSEGSTPVTSIHSSLQLEQSLTSQHLRVLRDAGLVEAARDGKFVMYRVNYQKAANIVNAVRRFLHQSED